MIAKVISPGAFGFSFADGLRWGILLCWTLVMTYLLAIFDPSSVRFVIQLSRWSESMGFSRFAPAKAFHLTSYFLWTLLALGAVARGYFRAPSPKVTLLFVVGSLVYVVCPEALQLLNGARMAKISDIGYNAVGFGLGLTITLAVSAVRGRSPEVVYDPSAPSQGEPQP